MKDTAAKAEPSSEILIACGPVLAAQHFTLRSAAAQSPSPLTCGYSPTELFYSSV